MPDLPSQDTDGPLTHASVLFVAFLEAEIVKFNGPYFDDHSLRTSTGHRASVVRPADRFHIVTEVSRYGLWLALKGSVAGAPT